MAELIAKGIAETTDLTPFDPARLRPLDPASRSALGSSFRLRLPRASAKLRGHRWRVVKMDFTGKVALVTGGGNGIGRATSAAFARHGAKVVVVDRDGAGAEATAGIIRQNGGDAIAVTADVTKSEDVKAYVRTAIEKYGQIDCFFNNAGIEGKVAATAEYDEAVFDA